VIKILLFIKHHLGFLWKLIEALNGWLFGLLFERQINRNLQILLEKSYHKKFIYKKLEEGDLPKLHDFFDRQNPEQFRFFKPHAFSLTALQRLYQNQAFLMLGVFDSEKLIGYFFLRFFLNKKCFIGRIVDDNYQRQGVAKSMNEIMYQTIWQSSFRCLSTISKHNKSIVNFHQKGDNIRILKELPNDYLFVEIVKPEVSHAHQ
jgi:hypothetical protein